MLKRLEEIEKYLTYVRQNIEHDKENLELDQHEQDIDDDSIDFIEDDDEDKSNNDEVSQDNNNNRPPVRMNFDNNNKNNASSHDGAHVLTENLINIGNCGTETNGSVRSSPNSIVASPVYYRAVRLNRPTEEELLKWDLYRNQEDLPKPWTFFKLTKSVYRPPENILDDFNNGHQFERQKRDNINKDNYDKNINYDKNFRPEIMNNNLNNNNNNNNLNINSTDQKSNPWKAREGNVSKCNFNPLLKAFEVIYSQELYKNVTNFTH